MGLLAYLGLFWALSYVFHRFLSSRKRRALRNLKLFRKHLVAKVRLDSDVLLEKNLDTLNATVAELDETVKASDDISADELEKKAKGWMKRVEKAAPAKENASIRETVEMLVVVFGIVMGIRAIVMQPFKIPTGSMQPTLYGIHFEDEDSVNVPGPLMAFWNWINFSASTADVVVKRDGFGEVVKDGSVKIGRIPISSKTVAVIGGIPYELPGPLNAVHKVNPIFSERDGRRVLFEGKEFKTGDVLARGNHYTGDHIMVDRFSYRFAEPKRGDVFVFVTDGLHLEGVDPEGVRRKVPLNGRHYIKRLVGLPGDTLMIQEKELWVKEKGESEFVKVDGRFHKAFDRIYSHKGGYHGYTTDGYRYLREDGDTVTLGKDEYFAMGDNSAHSQDSRYFGPVPRKNIIGKALAVWWPFSRRWGLVDWAKPKE